MTRSVGIFLVGVALLVLAGSSQAAAPKATLSDIEDEVMCITCGTALSLSESPLAQRQRALIQRLIDRGLTKAQIKAELVDEFGPEVLAAPPRSGFTVTAYLVPVVVLVLAVTSILLGARRRRGRSSPDDDVPSQDDFAARVDADLAGVRGGQ